MAKLPDPTDILLVQEIFDGRNRGRIERPLDFPSHVKGFFDHRSGDNCRRGAIQPSLKKKDGVLERSHHHVRPVQHDLFLDVCTRLERQATYRLLLLLCCSQPLVTEPVLDPQHVDFWTQS